MLLDFGYLSDYQDTGKHANPSKAPPTTQWILNYLFLFCVLGGGGGEGMFTGLLKLQEVEVSIVLHKTEANTDSG